MQKQSDMTFYEALITKRLAAELQSLRSEGWIVKHCSERLGFIKLQHSRNGSSMTITKGDKRLLFYKDGKFIKSI